MLKSIAVTAALLISLLQTGTAVGQESIWDTYKRHFISADGRIIDHFQKSNSHSEGQGYGLLLSVLQKDRHTFNRILNWTESNLQVRRDALSAWSWGKRPNGKWKTIDYNNATDGDLLIAYAMLRAHGVWQHQPYKQKAIRIISDIRNELAWEKSGYLVLSPAYFGFESGAGVVINSSYMIFSAFSAFAEVDDRPFWQRVREDSLRLLDRNRFSRFGLPADWVMLEREKLAVHAGRSPFFGYEAIRIPLYLAMAGENSRLDSFADYLEFVKGLGYLPDRVNLVEGTISADKAPAGFYAIFGKCARILNKDDLANRLESVASAKLHNEPRNYYSFSLYLLSKVSF